MCDFIHLLPRDIIQHIIPYTYACQTPQLIEDINQTSQVNKLFQLFTMIDGII